MLESNTVTEVFPLNFGGVGLLEPQPIVITVKNDIERVVNKRRDDAEGAEDQPAFMDSSNQAGYGALTRVRDLSFEGT